VNQNLVGLDAATIGSETTQRYWPDVSRVFLVS
jgi:hypothetical protein